MGISSVDVRGDFSSFSASLIVGYFLYRVRCTIDSSEMDFYSFFKRSKLSISSIDH